jgi:uncharacterized protein involved in type VI secretion and phage assembly
MISKLIKYRDYDYEDISSKIYGVVPAIVTNNKDPDGLARIKVKFPWMGEAKESETFWARVATFMAGNERGSYFIPEVDDEVLVAFENGDINYPYMIGALWNGKDKPTEKNDDGKNDIRSFTSRSGHKITFDDKDGEEKIIIKDKSEKREIIFDVKEKFIEIHNNEDKGEIKVFSKGKITVETEDELSIYAKKDISIKSDENISIEAKKDIKLTSKANTSIDSGSKLDVKSKSASKFTSNAQIEMKATSGAKFESSGKLDIKATGPAKMESSAKLDLKATGPTTVESAAITSVKGSMVKLG